MYITTMFTIIIVKYLSEAYTVFRVCLKIEIHNRLQIDVDGDSVLWVGYFSNYTVQRV